MVTVIIPKKHKLPEGTYNVMQMGRCSIYYSIIDDLAHFFTKDGLFPWEVDNG